MQQRFPEDIECIVKPDQGKGGIYVSNIEVAENPRTLQRFGIGSVITAIKGKNLSNVIPKHIEYLYIPVVDSESENISRFFQETNSFMEEELQRTNVLVHCMAGISRSVAIVIAFLMSKNKQPFSQVYQYVRSRRKIIHPNDSFILQLKQFQKKIGNQPLLSQNSNKLVLKQIMKAPNNKDLQSGEKDQNISDYDRNLRQNIRRVYMGKKTVIEGQYPKTGLTYWR